MRNDDPKFAARFQNAMNFLNGLFNIIQMLQKMKHRHSIRGFIRKWPRKD